MQLFLINALCTYVSGFFLFSHCPLLISGSGYFLHVRLNHLESIQGHYQKHSKSLEHFHVNTFKKEKRRRRSLANEPSIKILAPESGR